MVTKPRAHAARAAGCVALALLACASGCAPAVRPPAGAPADASQPQSAGVAPARAGTEAWRIDPDATVVTIVVRRAGPLARLGHDHVITSGGESGSVWLGATPDASSFELQLPVGQFDVDLPQARAAAGAEFAAPVPEEARQATRRNLLRAEVLDEAGHPLVVLRSVTASGSWAQAQVGIAVQIRGVERREDVLVTIERDAGRLVARGELRLRQSDYGITPFAVAGGAIQVADTLELRFEIVAVPG
jgi:YceI-like domain